MSDSRESDTTPSATVEAIIEVPVEELGRAS